jgi:hypothetical protein
MNNYQKPRREDSGVLYPSRQQKNEKSPTHYGSATLSATLLKKLVEAAKQGQPITLELAAWRRTNEYGELWSLSLKEPFRRDGEAVRSQPTSAPSNAGTSTPPQNLDLPWQ